MACHDPFQRRVHHRSLVFVDAKIVIHHLATARPNLEVFIDQHADMQCSLVTDDQLSLEDAFRSLRTPEIPLSPIRIALPGVLYRFTTGTCLAKQGFQPTSTFQLASDASS
jgi:hypothetical protein